MVDLKEVEDVAMALRNGGMRGAANRVDAAIAEIREHRERLSARPPQAIEYLRSAVSILQRYGEHEVASTVDCAIEVFLTLIRVPPWTKEKPIAPGWYWVRDELAQATGGSGDPCYITLSGRLTDRRGLITGETWPVPDDWEYSPIPEPPRGGPQAEGSE